MNYTMRFTLPEEEEEFRNAVFANDWRAACEDILNMLHRAEDEDSLDSKTVAALKQRVGFIAADALTLRDKLWYVTTTTENALTILKASPAVAYAEPDYVVTAADATPTEFDNNPTLPSYGADAWWLRKINAPAAWDISAGGETILAVLDTGVDYTHSDVKKNMWVNPNGASDGLHGYDFVDGDPDPMDVGGHGTHVAGILGARQQRRRCRRQLADQHHGDPRLERK